MRRIALTALGFALLLTAVPLFSQTNATIEKTLESNEQAGLITGTKNSRGFCSQSLAPFWSHSLPRSTQSSELLLSRHKTCAVGFGYDQCTESGVFSSCVHGEPTESRDVLQHRTRTIAEGSIRMLVEFTLGNTHHVP